jgi:hypothetical protein
MAKKKMSKDEFLTMIGKKKAVTKEEPKVKPGAKPKAKK